MMWNGSSMVVYGTDGVCSSIGQMNTVNNPSDDSKTILMESHEYANLKDIFWGLYLQVSHINSMELSFIRVTADE